MASRLPNTYDGTDDFYDMWAATGYQEYDDYKGDGGGMWIEYPDVDPNNGYADFYDAYLKGIDDPDIILKPSQGHAGT